MQNIFNTVYDFHTARDIIQKELLENFPDKELPDIFPENNSICIRHKTSDGQGNIGHELIKIMKSRIENVRIHSVDSHYLCLQSLNDNIYNTENLLNNLKLRIFSAKNPRIEFSKYAGLTGKEIYVIVEAISFLNKSMQKFTNPVEELESLGIQVYFPNALETLDEIAGYESVKEEITESIILPLKNPETFREISSLTRKTSHKNLPRAILFEGSPGVGKTTFARVAAGMAGLPLVYIPVESILSKYYGESAARLSRIFDLANSFPSSLLFLDEIDSLVGNRENGMFEATRNILSVLLRKLDGINTAKNSILIAATNRKNDLDAALLSRFERKITFELPDHPTRSKIFRIYAIHMDEKQAEAITQPFENFSGRDIRDFCDFVERKWAVKIIESGEGVTSPDFEFYRKMSLSFKKS